MEDLKYVSRSTDRMERRFYRPNHRQRNHRHHPGLGFPNHRRHNNRHQNNKDWNWDVYGNSDGNWDLRVGKEW